MNVERIQKCIAMLEAANENNFSMIWYQNNTGDVYHRANNVVDLHRCGNTACFAGYLTISDFFKEDGGECKFSYPVYKGYDESDAVAAYLDISVLTATSLVFGDVGEGRYSNFYGKHWEEVKPNDVIKKLKELLDRNETCSLYIKE